MLSSTPNLPTSGVDSTLAIAAELARWAIEHAPTEADRALADRSLIDTLAVAAAARGRDEVISADVLERAGRTAMLAHLIDFDDLHIPTTTHISAVCVPAALAAGGGAEAYLAGAGVMARLGAMLGWRHYEAGWHATCTAGAPAAAVVAALALGLDTAGVETAIALAVPAAGGVNRAFGTIAKSLQVGFAVDAGVRAARLAAAGARADGAVLGQWLALVGGVVVPQPAEPSIPGGLAVKAYPCCYALQRPIAAVLNMVGEQNLTSSDVHEIVVRTPLVALRPLIHSRPSTGLEGKFSLQYGIAAAVLDGAPGRASFTDAAVQRPEAQRLIRCVAIETTPGGEDLLTGTTEVELRLADGSIHTTTLALPPGSPGQPLGDEDLMRKVRDCAGDEDAESILKVGWSDAGQLVDSWFEA